MTLIGSWLHMIHRMVQFSVTLVDFQGHFRYCKCFRYVLYIKYTAYIMYEVNYDGRTSYVSIYFYCHVRLEGLVYDAERDLIGIAKFLVVAALVGCVIGRLPVPLMVCVIVCVCVCVYGMCVSSWQCGIASG